MAAKTIPDPVAQAQQLLAEGRHRFARDVDEVLADISIDMATVRQAILEKFEAALPMQSLADPVLLQLVQEAYDHFENPDSTVDIDDWVLVATQFVRGKA